MIRTTLFALLIGVCASTMTSCSKGNDDDNTSATAKVNMHLTDAPADYEHVYVDIQRVEVTMQGSSAVTLTPIRPGVYDLLDFSNGIDTLLLTTNLPTGTIEQIRLVLGTNNSVDVGGQSYAMTTPSGQTSGVKLNLNQSLQANQSYDFWIDFDAGKSVHETGNGKYMLKPVIRAYSALTNGKIKGVALPLSALITVYAINGPDTFSAVPDITTGGYAFAGLPAGTYSVMLDAGVVSFVDTTVANVQVQYGTTTDVGTILLHL
ncbi:DUF4382 domain-containing protein [Polluticoccus soli]|uniref:DUF4382 domain-containing protein n=1 Tax=Polluticoccus soli TaxID=3034150 RepID=UPI0023E16A83|nr:DUF4382 domain-containing protein [Flavipsychrobacter sp. JY13-12]